MYIRHRQTRLLLYIHNNFLSKFLTQLKSRILTIKIGVMFLCKNLFFFARLNRFLYFWVFKCQISACRFLNHQVLICGFLLYVRPVFKHCATAIPVQHLYLHVSAKEKTSPKDYIHIHSRVYMYFIFLYFLNYWIHLC